MNGTKHQLIWKIDWEREQTTFNLVTRFMQHLQKRGYLGSTLPNASQFYSWFHRINAIPVDATAITPGMALLLFCLGYTHRLNGTMIACGSYQGLPFHCLIAGIIANGHSIDDRTFIGLDIDADAVERAKLNAAALQMSFIKYMHTDALAWLENPPPNISLIYLDLDDPIRGKADYSTIFHLVKCHMMPGGVLLAHDATSPTFQKDIAALRQFITESGLFSETLVIPIDNAGLLMTTKKENGYSD